MTQDISRLPLYLECLTAFFDTGMVTNDSYTWQIKFYLLYCCNVELLMKFWKWVSPLTQALLMCIILRLYLCLSLRNTMNILIFFCMDIWHAWYRMILIFIHETLLFDTCLCHGCFIIDRVWQSLYICHNKITHISSVEAHNDQI